ncbi:3'5'-cyclic nucleotide phosphodiesterase [Aphelenchoides bicaudatus]|nr:3'5'-cyclic nucleotide phosphodiesterase [Aphelenchoides bicaudatus]
MRQATTDLPANGRSNGIIPQSILKDSSSPTAKTYSESRKVRHLSNDNSTPSKSGVPCNALRSEEEREETHTIRERTLRNRRTSLPVANNFFPPRTTAHQPQLNEARGLIMEMLNNQKEVPPNIVTCLKAVAQLLNTPQTSGMHGFNFNELGLPKVVENPYSGEQLLVSSASKPRVSNITFSTDSRPLLLSHNIVLATSHDQVNEVAACTCSSKTASACILHPGKESNNKGRRRYSSPTAEKLSSGTQRHTSEPSVAGFQQQIIGTQNSCITSTKEDVPNLLLNERRFSNSASPVPTPSPSNFLSSTPTFTKSPSLIAKSPSPSVAFIQEESEDLSEEGDHDIKPTTTAQLPENQAAEKRESLPSVGSPVSPTPEIQTVQTSDGTVFDFAEIEKDPTLRRISEWSFPIFHFAERHKRSVLSRLTFSIFKQADLFNIFKISPVKFFNFFHSLELHYHDITYHNRVHAADVLHACHYLTCHPVRAFLGRPPTPDFEDTDDGIEPLSFGSVLDSAPLPVSFSMNPLELMALYTAAAAHDVDHPGRTNAFLVASEDRKAILYNDRSVLENHHAAESWRILSQTQNNFIESLDAAETKRFRYLVLEFILATDLKQHFDIILTFNEKAAEIELSSESDRVLISQMLIKFADINSPAKPFNLHRHWTDRICQEFYEQGDEEKRRGMPISPYMDRNEPAVAKLQDSFIAHIVNPLVMALNEAGLLPILPGLEEPELLINLKHNHQRWLVEIEQQQESSDEAKEQSDSASSATTAEAEQQTKQKEEVQRPNGTINKAPVEDENVGRFECWSAESG